MREFESKKKKKKTLPIGTFYGESMSTTVELWIFNVIDFIFTFSSFPLSSSLSLFFFFFLFEKYFFPFFVYFSFACNWYQRKRSPNWLEPADEAA